MKRDRVSFVLWKYILQYRLVVTVFFLFVGIFASIFSLYRLETEAVLYAASLCVLCSFVIVSCHFHFYLRKHRALTHMQQNIELFSEELLSPSNLLEEDLYKMVATLQKVNHTTLNEWKAKQSASVDYYTTWVHQIKGPIAVMRLILQSEESVQNKELLSELFRIEQYTEMVLCYTRLDSKSPDLLIRKVALDSTVRQAIRKFAPQFVYKKISLQYEGSQIQVLTDEKWLLFIIEQLLSNAIKYTETGSVSITVTDQKQIVIKDTGIGIAKEDLPRIFEKGFTGYNGHADKKATGLGLYLCKRIAKKLAHTISITSCVGEGTIATIDLNSDTLEVE